MAPAVPDTVGTFERIFDFEYEKVPIVLYRCKDTGLRLALARVQSPTVHGYFAVQTEAFDDYGCPHTLEHLIFLGSERYPYKGVLDVLANRCLAQGTNAWTDVDHTCYTIDTAGSAGFLKVLPVYLDHVLFPTLKDTGFVTEVHHINSEGANAGVVYCEMQARENEADDRVDRAVKLAAYPGQCSYKSETGGRLKELRELNNMMVRDYHKSYYRPDNLCVIITGQVDCESLCAAVQPVIESIKSSERIKALPQLTKPFSAPVPRPQAPVLSEIDFPAEDEKTGAMVTFAWHGPKWDDHQSIRALRVMFTYLCQDSISPLQKAFVEVAPPLCSSVDFSMLEQTVQLLEIELTSVDVEQLSKREVDKELSAVLESVTKAGGEGFDLARMHSIIRQQKRRHLSSVEEQPHDFFSGEIIGSFLYATDFGAVGNTGTQGAALQHRLNAGKELDSLLDWPADKWATLCKQWLCGPDSCPRVTVIGRPSKACGEKIQAEDAARIEKQKAELGDEGCRKAGEAVNAAEEENDVDTPDEVAQEFEIPSVSSIELIDVVTVKVNGSAGGFEAVHGKAADEVRTLLESSASEAGGAPGPVMQFVHTDGTQFASMVVMLPTDALSTTQLALLPLWCDVGFELPFRASDAGPAMGYEEVVKSLTDTTVDKDLSMGVNGSSFIVGDAGNMLAVHLKVENAKYAEGPLLLGRVLADVQFDTERLQVAAKRLLNDVPNVKRESRKLMAMAMRAMSYRDEAPHGAFNAFRVEKVLQAIVASDEALKRASEELAAIQASLLSSPVSMLVCFGGDVRSLGKDIFGPWRRHPFLSTSNGTAGVPKAPSFKPLLAREFFSQDALRPAPGAAGGCLISSTNEESNYWLVQCEAISDPQSPELAPLLVAIEYLTALEGPFWRKIRGKGLAYSYDISHSLEQGYIKASLFKATDPLAAFKEAGNIVTQLCAEEDEDDDEKKEKEESKEKELSGGTEDVPKDGQDGEEGEDDEDETEDDGLDPSALEAAQSGVLFSLIESVDTIPAAMSMAMARMLSQEPPDQLQRLLKEVQDVTPESVKAAMQKYVLPLFDGSKGRVASMVCPATKKATIEEGLAKLEPPFKIVHLDVESLVNTLVPSNGFKSLRDKAAKAVAAGGNRKMKKRKADRGTTVKSDDSAARQAKGKAKSKKAETHSAKSYLVRKTDPEDGLNYTFDDIVAFYSEMYTRIEIRSYWEQKCKPAPTSGSAAGKAKAKAKATATKVSDVVVSKTPERRVDPEDGVAYTFEELAAFYAGKYKKKAIEAYWDECSKVQNTRRKKR